MRGDKEIVLTVHEGSGDILHEQGIVLSDMIASIQMVDSHLQQVYRQTASVRQV